MMSCKSLLSRNGLKYGRSPALKTMSAILQITKAKHIETPIDWSDISLCPNNLLPNDVNAPAITRMKERCHESAVFLRSSILIHRSSSLLWSLPCCDSYEKKNDRNITPSIMAPR